MHNTTCGWVMGDESVGAVIERVVNGLPVPADVDGEVTKEILINFFNRAGFDRLFMRCHARDAEMEVDSERSIVDMASRTYGILKRKRESVDESGRPGSSGGSGGGSGGSSSAKKPKKKSVHKSVDDEASRPAH